jgi:hypothetical protein
MNQTTWNTADELLWLDSIGKNHVHTRAMTERELLARYLEGARLRTRWGAINKAQVVRHVVQRHAELMAATREVPA